MKQTDSLAISQINAEALIAQAIDKNIPVESMERLLAMRRELRAEWAKEQFDKAMAAFQADCPIIEKKEKAGGSSGYGYKYAPLDQIVGQVKDILSAHGFSYTFDTQKTESTILVTCHVKHADGHSESSRFEAVVDTAGKMNATQKDGSASTYGKRYAFCNAFGILTGDEDTDGAVHETAPAKATYGAQGLEPLPTTPKPITDKQVEFIGKLIQKHKYDGTQFRSISEFETAMSERQGKPFQVSKLTSKQAAEFIDALLTKVKEIEETKQLPLATEEEFNEALKIAEDQGQPEYEYQE